MITCKPHQLQHILNGQRRIKQCCERAKKELEWPFMDHAYLKSQSEIEIYNFYGIPIALNPSMKDGEWGIFVPKLKYNEL